MWHISLLYIYMWRITRIQLGTIHNKLTRLWHVCLKWTWKDFICKHKLVYMYYFLFSFIWLFPIISGDFSTWTNGFEVLSVYSPDMSTIPLRQSARINLWTNLILTDAQVCWLCRPCWLTCWTIQNSQPLTSVTSRYCPWAGILSPWSFYVEPNRNSLNQRLS